MSVGVAELGFLFCRRPELEQEEACSASAASWPALSVDVRVESLRGWR
jgi:hypothetical protein